jgi:uncharacterized protein (TIGR02246 family)
MTPDDEVRALYAALLDAWNRRSAGDFAGLFAKDGNCVGFDGSPLDGRAAIEATLGRIFADHPTARYVGIVREVRLLSADAALVRAVAGMVPRGQADVNPALNAMQSLVAVRSGETWQVALFHNTPAAYHGRPEESERLTAQLREALRASPLGPAPGDS